MLLLKRFANTYKFCDVGINKFCLVLRKGYLDVYKYMYIWESFYEVSLPNQNFKVV